jgi:DNA-binding response OmpR family regulator
VVGKVQALFRAHRAPYVYLEAVYNHKPDVVLLAVTMPGMNGFDVFRQIRRFSDVPVLMVTGHGGDTDSKFRMRKR